MSWLGIKPSYLKYVCIVILVEIFHKYLLDLTKGLKKVEQYEHRVLEKDAKEPLIILSRVITS